MRGTLKACASLLLCPLMSLAGTCIIFRNVTLILRQHIHSEALLGVKVGMSSRLVIDANQHQLWIERHRRESISCHAVYVAFVVHGDHRNSGGKAPHRFTKFCLSGAHWKPGDLASFEICAR